MADAEAADVEVADQAQVEEEVAEEEAVAEAEAVVEEEESVMRSRRRRSGVALALSGRTNSAQPHPPVAVVRLPVPRGLMSISCRSRVALEFTSSES